MSSQQSQFNTQLRFAASMGKIPHDHTKGPPKKVKKSATTPSSSSSTGAMKSKRQKKDNQGGKSRGKDNDDVILSEEMSEWISSTFQETDEDGFLKESLGSQLVRPLDAMAIFTPTASIISSKTAAAKIPPNPRSLSTTQINRLAASQSSNMLFRDADADSLDVTKTSSLSGVFDEEVKSPSVVDSTDKFALVSTSKSSSKFEPPLPLMQTSEYYLEQTLKEHEQPQASFSQAVDTLEVMWLKRKAMFEEEDGDYDQAVKTLETAIEIHLGPEGSEDYSKARLAEPVVASDPMELIREFEETFVPYDIKPHAAAERIQRFFRKFERKKAAAQLLLSKIYRGYYYRQIYRKHIYVRNQCAYLIQRRFRTHLGRVIILSNKLKGWYKMRVRMRDYTWRLYFYRMAKRIQKRFRGILGRRSGFRQKFRITGAIMIQRNFRAYLRRRQRFIALAECHRRLYYAARRIQKRMRIFNAIRKAQDKLVGVSIEEEERMGEEAEVYEETIRIETEKLALYLKTEAGRLHLGDSRATIKAKDNAYNKIKSTLTKDEIDTHEAKIAFEIFDTDGSGQIDVDELSNMLTELCIPMEREEVIELAEEMDGDGSGDIDFDEFLEWYSGKGQKVTSVGALLFKQVLKARSAIMEATGVTLAKRTELDVLRQVTTWSARDTACMYRMKNPPKYSCCRCMAPFVLFSEYYGHFEDGINCPQTKEKAVYYRNFAEQQEWTYQRMVEAEIMRERDENPCLQYASTMAIYEDLALQQDSSFKLGVQSYLIAAKDMFLDKLNEDNGTGLGTYLVDIVNMSGDGVLYPFIAKRIGKLLGHPIPEEWVAEDDFTLEKFKEWATELYPDGEPTPTPLYAKIANTLMMVKKAEADAKILGYAYFVCLRLLTASTEAQLGALIALRKKRPRAMNMSEEQLDSLDLSHLTLKGYNHKRDVLVKRMKNLNSRMQELVVLSLKPKPPCCAFLAKKTEEYASVSPSDLSDAAFRDLRVLDAHNSAAARLRSFERTRAGKMYVRRLASELWARKRMIQEERSLIDVRGSSGLESIQYDWEKLASSITNEGIDPYDVDIFQNLFSLKISKDDMPNVIQDLADPTTGFIELDGLINWLTSRKAEAYMNMLKRITNGTDFVVKWLLMMMYITDARTKCLALFRKMARIDIELHHRIIERYIKAADADEEMAGKADMKKLEEPEDDKKKNKNKNKNKGNDKDSEKESGDENLEKGKKKTKKKKKETDKGDVKSSKKKDNESDIDQSENKTRDTQGEKQKLSLEENEEDGANVGDQIALSEEDVSELDSKALKIAAGIEDLVEDAPPTDMPPTNVPPTDMPPTNVPPTDAPPTEPVHHEEVLDPAVAEAIAEEQALKEESKMQETLDLLRSEFKLAEEKLVYKMTEDDAEYSARKRFFSRVGRYQIKHEKLLMNSSSVLFQAFSYCVSPISSLPAPLKPSRTVSEKSFAYSPMISSPAHDEASYMSASQELDQLLQPELESNLDRVDDKNVGNLKHRTDAGIFDILDDQSSSYSPLKNEDSVIDSPVNSPLNTFETFPKEEESLEDISAQESFHNIDTAWKLAISTWIYTFDTDCSGTFDESEVNLLLKYLLCGISERQLLLQFPEVNKDSASLDTMIEYLVTKVIWLRGLPDFWTNARSAYVLTMSSHSASTMLLISLQRQAARELAVQTFATQKGTRDDEEESRNEDAVIMRSQMFAMRQVEMFLKNVFGKLQIAVELERLNEVFAEEVRECGFTKQSLLTYAYHVHRNYSGMMNTELCHVVRFIVLRLKMKTTVDVTNIADLLSAIKTKGDLKTLSLRETLEILDPCFEDPLLDSKEFSTLLSRNVKKTSISTGKRKDAIYAIFSKARQQAIQIAVQLGGVHAADTNYRCLILGLDATKRRTFKSKIWRGLYHFEIGRDKSINWLEVPREATMLLLLSRGYLMKDMTLPRTRGVTGAYHPSGNLGDDLVDVHDVVFCSRRDEAMTMNFFQSAYRWCRYPFGLPRYIEYKRTVAVLTKHRKDITIIGAMFLKELVAGTSHCGDVETLRDSVI